MRSIWNCEPKFITFWNVLESEAFSLVHHAHHVGFCSIITPTASPLSLRRPVPAFNQAIGWRHSRIQCIIVRQIAIWVSDSERYLSSLALLAVLRITCDPLATTFLLQSKLDLLLGVNSLGIRSLAQKFGCLNSRFSNWESQSRATSGTWSESSYPTSWIQACIQRGSRWLPFRAASHFMVERIR